MAVSPKGVSVQAAYRWFRDNQLIVNRRYQRKLVWSIEEKRFLIDSMLLDYPLPLFLFAEVERAGSTCYEIIDGMQRLNAIFGYIENVFPIPEGYFDIKEFPRARQAAEHCGFATIPPEGQLLIPNRCADFLDYQLAVTIFEGSSTSRITDVFGRINSSGKRLSDQERRQAGVVTPFAELVRDLAAEIRGDVSRPELLLTHMPEISIESRGNPHGYALQADNIFWCKQGIIRPNELRESVDEQIIADISASILLGKPIKFSGEFLDQLYDENSEDYRSLAASLSAYSSERIRNEIISVFSTIREIIEDYSDVQFCFRSVVYPKKTSNPLRSPFYALFMAVHELMYKEGRTPTKRKEIMQSLKGMAGRIDVGKKHIKEESRKINIKVVRGLIEEHFVKQDVRTLQHGPSMIFDFENSMRRSRTESARYEYKQGILRLDADRPKDDSHIQSTIETVCAVANVGPDADGFIYVGIADKSKDAERVRSLDGVEPVRFDDLFVVGVEREAKLLKLSIENYVRIFVDTIRASALSEPLRTQVLNGLDVINYKGRSVVRIVVPRQKDVSFVGESCFLRHLGATVTATPRQVAALQSNFQQATIT